MAAHYDWETIRAEYEAGASQNELAKKFSVSRGAIQKRIRKESWMQDVSSAVNRLAEAKVAGVVAGSSPQKKAEAVNAAAERKASIIRGHQQAWAGLMSAVRDAMNAGDFEKLKCIKITSETLRIVQDGEARAHGINDKTETDVSATVSVTHSISPSVAELLSKVNGHE